VTVDKQECCQPLEFTYLQVQNVVTSVRTCGPAVRARSFLLHARSPSAPRHRRAFGRLLLLAPRPHRAQGTQGAPYPRPRASRAPTPLQPHRQMCFRFRYRCPEGAPSALLATLPRSSIHHGAPIGVCNGVSACSRVFVPALAASQCDSPVAPSHVFARHWRRRWHHPAPPQPATSCYAARATARAGRRARAPCEHSAACAAAQAPQQRNTAR